MPLSLREWFFCCMFASHNNTHTMKTQSSERIKAHTDFLEALGIIQAWQEKSDKENPQLTRLAELILAMLGRHQDLMLEVSDLGIMNSLIRNKKNEEIQKLKGM